MSRAEAERRFRHFRRGRDDALVELASHAALPVVLDPDFLHLLRVNYFLDPPVTLPYTAEAELLLSPLCAEVDQGLYVIDPDMRDVLLRHLIEQRGTGRLHDVARLLWEYGQRGTPWSDRPGLQEAQQLSALNFIDPARAQDWLTRAEAESGTGAEADGRWFVAMRQDLESRAAAVQQAQEQAESASGLTPAVAALCEALASRYPTAADALAISTRVGIVPAKVSLGTAPSGALWREIVTALAAVNGLTTLFNTVYSDAHIRPAIEEYWDRVRPALRVMDRRVTASPEWAVLDEYQEQIGRSLKTLCLMTARHGPGFHRSVLGLLAGRNVALTTRIAARALIDSLEAGRTGLGDVWLAFADQHATLPQVPADALLSGEQSAGLVRALVVRVEYVAETEIAALQFAVHPADAAAMPEPEQLTAPPADLAGRKVYILGYRSMADFPDGISRFAEGAPKVLCLQPGEIVGVANARGLISNDCLASHANEGSPLVDFITGQALGLQQTSHSEYVIGGVFTYTASVLSADVRGLVRMLDEEVPGLTWPAETARDVTPSDSAPDDAAEEAAQADVEGEPDFPISARDIDLLLREMARICNKADVAMVLLQMTGFPRELIPTWRDSAPDFWIQVFDELDGGVMRAPYRRLITVAIGIYPTNQVLRILQRRYQETDVPEQPAAKGKSGEAAADDVCHLVVWGDRAEQGSIQALLDGIRLAPEVQWSCPSSASFRLSRQFDPAVVRAVLDTHDDFHWVVVPPGHTDFLLRQFVAYGPDGRMFRFSDVPSATRVRDVGAELFAQYGDRPPSDNRPTAVDLVTPDGMPRRLDPESTLGDEGVTDHSELRVSLVTLAGGGPLEHREEADRETEPPPAKWTGDIVSELVDRYPDGLHGDDRPPVVDQVGPHDSGQRLDPESTHGEEGITGGSTIRVGFEPRAAGPPAIDTRHLPYAFEDLPEEVRDIASGMAGVRPGFSLRRLIEDERGNFALDAFVTLEQSPLLHFLAGYPVTPYTYRVSAAVSRGSRPDTTTLAALSAIGTGATVNLCAEMEGGDAPAIVAAGLAGSLRTRHFPVTDMEPPTVAQLTAILDLLSGPGAELTYVHCEAGRGRTGVVIACYRMAVMGWSPADALAEAVSFGCTVPGQLAFIRQFGDMLLAGPVGRYPLLPPGSVSATPEQAAMPSDQEAEASHESEPPSAESAGSTAAQWIEQFSAGLPDPERSTVADPAGTEPSPKGEAPLAGRIRVRGPQGFHVSAELVAGEPGLVAVIEDQSDLYEFYVVELSVDLGPAAANPRLESVVIALSLTSTPDTSAPVAISMMPMEARHETLSSQGDARVIKLGAVGGTIGLLAPALTPGTAQRSAAASTSRRLLHGAGLLTSQPRWEFKRQPEADLAGSYHLALVVRAAAGSTAVNVSGIVTARAGGSFIRRFRSELPNPLQFSYPLRPDPPA